MKTRILTTCFAFLSVSLFAQSITGKLSQLAKQEIKLEGFDGLRTYTIGKTTTDEQGHFTLNYTKNDIGVGYLISADNKPLFVILSGEDISLQGEALSYIETLKITKGDENKAFATYAIEHPKREQALSAWLYLEKIYATDTLFAVQKKQLEAIQKEKLRIKNEDQFFLDLLPKESYVKWFLPTRKLVSSVSTVAQYRTDEIPETLKAFRDLDYSDQRLYKSGLFKDAIESHFWLLENSGKPLDSVFIEMKVSIDAMLEKLVKNEKRLNEVTDHLFNLLEQHSLFQASEYLALSVLNQGSCTINSDLSKQLETYRAMKKGNIAPDILFDKASFSKPAQSLAKLSDLKSNYTLVIFAASWCPKCQEELPKIANFYESWKAKGVEVVFIGLEDDRKSFTNFAAPFPFPSYSDLKKWDSKIVKDYYVFGTPTLFLLNDKREIVLRPSSVEQVNSWITTYIVGSK